MRRSLSVKATYDGVVRLPMSLAMISTLRERKQAYQNSSLVSPRHPRRRPSRASSSPSSRFPRSVAMRSRAVAAETPRASPPRPSTPRRPTERTKNTHKKTRLSRVPSRASRVASPPTTARPSSLSPPFASSRASSIATGVKKNAPRSIHRARNSNAPIVLPDTDARIRRAEIDPDRGTFSLTHDDSRCAFVSRSREMSSRSSGRGRFASKEAFRRLSNRGRGGYVTSHHSSMDGRVPRSFSCFRACVRFMDDLMVCSMGIFLGIGSVGDDSSRVPPRLDGCMHEMHACIHGSNARARGIHRRSWNGRALESFVRCARARSNLS